MSDRLIDREQRPEDEFDTHLRPQKLAEFIGQGRAKANLKVFIEAARHREEPLDHQLFYGPPGLGKTTLANILAKEMGVAIRTTSGPAIERPGTLLPSSPTSSRTTSSSSTKSTASPAPSKRSFIEQWRTSLIS